MFFGIQVKTFWLKVLMWFFSFMVDINLHRNSHIFVEASIPRYMLIIHDRGIWITLILGVCHIGFNCIMPLWLSNFIAQWGCLIMWVLLQVKLVWISPLEFFGDRRIPQLIECQAHHYLWHRININFFLLKAIGETKRHNKPKWKERPKGIEEGKKLESSNPLVTQHCLSQTLRWIFEVKIIINEGGKMHCQWKISI